MIMMTMMMLDVLQDWEIVHDDKDYARCCGSAEKFS